MKENLVLPNMTALSIYQKINETLDQIAYFAIEGTGSIKEGTFEPKDYEVFDFMENGQPRFAIYDENGKLKSSADPILGKGGKPSKCMWCHESNIQPSFKRDPNEKLLAFNERINPRREALRQLQKERNLEIQFDSLAHHRNGEFPFASFMESNLYHIGQEFNLDTMMVQEKLAALKTHKSPHFPEFGFFYDRKDFGFYLSRMNPWKYQATCGKRANTNPICSNDFWKPYKNQNALLPIAWWSTLRSQVQTKRLFFIVGSGREWEHFVGMYSKQVTLLYLLVQSNMLCHS